MKIRSLLVVACCASAVLLPSVSADAAPAKTYKNCTELHKAYPHGVGRIGAKDKVRGKSKPVTTFTRSNALYNANKKSDADKDGIACEKR